MLRIRRAAPSVACRWVGPGGSGLPRRLTSLLKRRPEEFCCVGCQFAAEVQRERRAGAVLNWPLARLGLAIFLTMNVVMFTMALWTDSVYSTGPNPAPGNALAQPLADLYRYLSLMLSLPVLWLLGGPLARSAWQNLWRGSGAADLLLLMGVVASFVYSTVSVLRRPGTSVFRGRLRRVGHRDAGALARVDGASASQRRTGRTRETVARPGATRRVCARVPRFANTTKHLPW